jgi:hypothetical protein
VLDELRNVFTKQRKRRVCDHNIGLLQQSYSFRAAEITVPLQVQERWTDCCFRCIRGR